MVLNPIYFRWFKVKLKNYFQLLSREKFTSHVIFLKLKLNRIVPKAFKGMAASVSVWRYSAKKQIVKKPIE